MALSSVTDLIALFTHAYCTEGPEFQAIAPVATGGTRVGPMSLDIPITTLLVATWPDEVATADLAQATDANKPFYTPSSSDMNNLPTIWTGDPSDKRFLSVDWTDIAQPFEVVVVARVRSLSNGRPIFDSSGGGFGANTSISVGGAGAGTGWAMSLESGGGVSQGGTRDSSKHLFRLAAGATDQVYIDETLTISGGSGDGNNSMLGLTVGSSLAGITGTAGYNDYCFVGVKSGALTAGNRTDIHSFCQSHYGTP